MKELKVNLRTDAGLVSSEMPTTRVLEIAFTAPQGKPGKEAAPLNLALVIDRSGSMSGGKLEQAKDAAAQVLNLMRPKDSVSIIDYDDHINITAESSSVTDESRREMMIPLSRMHPGGSTDLGGGWLMGCERVANRLAPGKINRTLLLTDGQANVGITNPADLGQHASALFERGVATSTFGIGEGFNEHLLEAMSNRGGGNFYYIDHTDRISELLMKEFSDLAAVTLRNVVIELAFPVGVNMEFFGDWRSTLEAQKLTIFLSDLAAGRTINLFVRFLAPAGKGQLVMSLVIKGMDEDGGQFTFTNDITLQYASQAKVDAVVKDAEVDTHFASVIAGQMRIEALKLEREGRRGEAREVMDTLMSSYGPALPAHTRMRHEHTRSDILNGFNESRRKTEQRDSYLEKKFLHPEQQTPDEEQK